MLYLIKSYGYKGKVIYKVGFTNDITKRFNQYFSANPECELITTRPGNLIDEKLIHLYLCHKGYQYKKYGRLSEWYINDPMILQLFHYSISRIQKYVWKHRDSIFDFTSKTGNSETEVYTQLFNKFSNSTKTNLSCDITYKKRNVIDNFLTPEQLELLNLINNERNQYQRMKLLCKLRPSLELVKSISNYIQGDYLESLCILGYDQTKACGYRSTTMRDKVRELSTDLTGLMVELDKIFLPGTSYFLPDIKEKLREAYIKFNYTRHPKASDIEDWFEVKFCLLKDSSGKRSKAYEIIKKK